MLTPVIATLLLPSSAGFLLPGIALVPPTRASTLRSPIDHYTPASRAAIRRAPTPQAFDGGGLDLSTDELIALARARGIVVNEDATAADLLLLLGATATDQTTTPSFDSAEQQRVDVFERVAPSVAYIQTSIVGGNSPFALAGMGREYPAGSGSGFVWDADGHVVTNYHVVAGGAQGRPSRGADLPRKITVKLMGRDEQIEATVVGTEPDKDIAVLKIDPAALGSAPPLEAAVSADLKVGQSVLAIGNPFGLDWTLTQGIVSALGRDIDGAGGRPIRDCVQTDAAINPGNSGGPLLDSRGRLIGVNTMIFSQSGGSVGIGFAVPADTVKRVVNQIIERGPNARPSLGISVLPDVLRKQYAKSLKRRTLEGAIIAEVVKGSPADGKLAPCERRGAGVLLGDMIVSVNGEQVTKNEDLLCLIEESEPDQPIRIEVMKACDPERLEEIEVTPVPRKDLSAAS